MSGWENVPDEAPKQPAPRGRRAAAATTTPQAIPDDAAAVDDSDFAQFVEMHWPHAWIMMLTTVCLIGVWKAISHLPNAPSWWP